MLVPWRVFFTVTFPMLHRVRGGMVFLRLDDFDPIGLMQLLHASSRLVFFFGKKKHPVFAFETKTGEHKETGKQKNIYLGCCCLCCFLNFLFM